MASTLKRLIAAAGATSLLAGAAIAIAPSAQADGDYYGTWTLTAIKGDGRKQKCEGPAQGTDVCPGGQLLTLKSNYRYTASAYLAQNLWLGAKGNTRGSFVTPVLPDTGQQILVLESDRNGILPLGSAWQMELMNSRSGTPTKMVLTLQTGFFEASLVFKRDVA
ncbi:MAG: hypothetical protein ACO3JT_07690 [Candidatus Nanopelagicales bacterium]